MQSIITADWDTSSLHARSSTTPHLIIANPFFCESLFCILKKMLCSSTTKFLASPRKSWGDFSQFTIFKIVWCLIILVSTPSLCSRELRRGNVRSGRSAAWGPVVIASEVSITSTETSPIYSHFPPSGYQNHFWGTNANGTDNQTRSSGVGFENSFDYVYSDTDQRQERNSVMEDPPNQQLYDMTSSYAPRTELDSYFPENYHAQGHHHNTGGGYAHVSGHISGGGWEKPEFEIEDKLFTKTIAATKVLKAGKMVFTICMILVVLVMAGLGKLGVNLSPAALPLALLPIGFIALILFVPLFLVYIPIVATGHAGGERRRKRSVKSLDNKNEEVKVAEIEEYFSTLEENFLRFLQKIER